MFILMISIIIALVIVIFAVQNAAVVPVQFITWSTDLPLVLIIFCSVFAGALLMFCLALWRQLKNQMGKKAKNNKVNKKTPDKEDPIEVPGLKDITIKVEKSDENINENVEIEKK